MGEAKKRREAIAQGQPDPGPSAPMVRTVRILRTADGGKAIRIFDQVVPIDGEQMPVGARVTLVRQK